MAVPLGPTHYYRAVVVGQNPGAPIEWTWNLTVPKFDGGRDLSEIWDGVVVTPQDGTLLIGVTPYNNTGEGPWDEDGWWTGDYVEAQLTCTATVAGAVVGTVVLRPYLGSNW